MSQHAPWNPYTGSGSIMLAIVLLIITGALVYLAMRLPHPIEVKRPGKAMGALIVVIWTLSVVMLLVAVTVYVLRLQKQVTLITGPANPITPFTMTAGLLAFVAILYLARRSGFWGAVGSAIVGTIAAPLIFELPFDLIVMWRTYPPTPATLFTLLYFLPLFLVELSSFAMLMLSPVMRVSRSSLLFLAGMFLVFAVWALFGFAYPDAPLPTTLNVLSKVLAFAAAVALFLPQGAFASAFNLAPSMEEALPQTPNRSGLI